MRGLLAAPVRLRRPYNAEIIPRAQQLFSLYNDTYSPWTYCHLNVSLFMNMNAIIQSKIKKKFGLQIRSFRKQRGFSQEDLAAVALLDRTYIGGIERGERNVSLINIYRLANALGVSPKELVK